VAAANDRVKAKGEEHDDDEEDFTNRNKIKNIFILF
jgi:hypothetical protein